LKGYRLRREQLRPHQHRLERHSAGTILEPLEARVIGLPAGSVDRCLRRADVWVGTGRYREAVSLVVEQDSSSPNEISIQMLEDVATSLYPPDNRYSDGTFGCQSVWMARAFQNQSYIVSGSGEAPSFCFHSRVLPFHLPLHFIELLGHPRVRRPRRRVSLRYLVMFDQASADLESIFSPSSLAFSWNGKLPSPFLPLFPSRPQCPVLELTSDNELI
jgi:hypothetical protein